MDILVLAVIAFLVFLRLYKVLGERTGFEKQPDPEQWARRRQDPVKPAQKKVDIVVGEEDQPLHADTLTGRLSQIHAIDRNFSENRFLRGARGAFEIIIKAYADGDKKTLGTLLTPAVYAQFADAIDQRKQRGEKLETTLIRLRDPDISDARIDGETMQLTVTFKSEQITTLRDKDGNVIDGDPERIYDVTDTWTFQRKANSSSTTWYLSETKNDD